MDLEWYIGIPVVLGIANAVRERMGITIDASALRKVKDKAAEAYINSRTAF